MTFSPNAMFREGLLESFMWHTRGRVEWAKEKALPSIQH